MVSSQPWSWLKSSTFQQRLNCVAEWTRLRPDGDNGAVVPCCASTNRLHSCCLSKQSYLPATSWDWELLLSKLFIWYFPLRERQRGRERKRETFFLELATNQVPDDDQCICGAFTTPLPWRPKGQIRRRVCARQLKEGLRVHSTVTFNRANEKRKSILWILLQHGQLGKNASNASVWAGATSEASQGRRGGVVAFPGSRAASDLFIPAPWHQ